MSKGPVYKDAEGQRIRCGSVLEKVQGDERGVVQHIYKVGDIAAHLERVGDLRIQRTPGLYTVSSLYATWKHVAHDDQTYAERYFSWLYGGTRNTDDQDDLYFFDEGVSSGERRAIRALMALLPSTAIDWDDGPWPDSLESTMDILRRYLEKLDQLKAEGGQLVKLDAISLGVIERTRPDSIQKSTQSIRDAFNSIE